MKKLLIFIIFIMPAVIFPADYFQEDLSYAVRYAEMRAYLEKNVPKRANILKAFEQMPQVIGNDNEVLVRLK